MYEKEQQGGFPVIRDGETGTGGNHQSRNKVEKAAV